MINPQEVDDVFKVCLFRKEEVKDGMPKPEHEAIFVEGITMKFGFHKERVNKRKEKIIGFLKELPEQFSKGGGWSFLNLCNDKDGQQWTGLQMIMQELVCLGIAIGKVKYLTPKDTWAALPGGVPYVAVSLN